MGAAHGGASGNLLNASYISQNESMNNFSSRSKSFANNVIHKLKRRVSFHSGIQSRPSFHMRSQANLSIYRVSEASNESPDKHSTSAKRRKQRQDNNKT